MSGGWLIAALCVAEVFTMLGFATFSALLPAFMAEWSLSATEAGWLSGVFFAGYMGAVPLLTGLTDRIDARRIYLWSIALTALATLAFALLARDVWSAAPLRLLAGAGLAGTYMPGLRALTDRVPARLQPRAVSFYTSSFGIGASASYWLAGEIGTRAGWEWAFVVGAAGAALSGFAVFFILKPRPIEAPARSLFAAIDFRPVLRNRQAMAYILAYGAHSFELFGLRSWIVVFLGFCAALAPESAAGFVSATAIAALMNLLAMPASIVGNEAAGRFGRRGTVAAIMLGSALLACGVGASPGFAYGAVVALVMLYAMTVAGESAALTTGSVQAAEPARTGATMALHSTVGFGCAFLGSLGPGVVLDLAGGPESRLAWALAFAAMGAGAALGPLAVWLLTRRRPTALPAGGSARAP